MVHSSQAQNSPQDYLNAHNAARAEVGVGTMTWDDTVAAFAQNYANQRSGDCNLVHSTNRPYGENIAVGSGDFTGSAAVDLWVGEKPNYDYNSNSCAAGQMCGHYTQVVWSDSINMLYSHVFAGSAFDKQHLVDIGFLENLNSCGSSGLATVHSSQAQNSPQDFLDAHNAARAAVGVGPMTWDDTVAAYAESYANQRIGDCALVHSHGQYGQNLAYSSGDFNAMDAVNMWIAEKPNYDYGSNSCIWGEMCLHYTQVVWSDSIRLGCARVQCYNGFTFVTCSYDPPGNLIGQRPY
ncbi:hypothetical protein F0562_028784 [Nyssa sinensis]|uniref:SCP domain-containing protein n=1 Tax=Nyssa sinensis TaxID=561372 RepID=A0A5J5B276_9ASTE|nr:hypothetical protein F0562_028784 [Nyssa sinensis]